MISPSNPIIIQNLHTKLSRTLGIMFEVKRFFPKIILLQLCYTMFNSHLLYCITVWTSTYSTYLNSIRMLQSKAVRLIAGFDDKHPTSSIYKSNNILKLDDTAKLHIAMFVHRHFNNDLPTNLRGYFTNDNTYHSISTRRRTIGYNYHLPRYRSSKLQRSIKYLGVSVWNAIPFDIRKCNSRRFKRKFKN